MLTTDVVSTIRCCRKAGLPASLNKLLITCRVNPSNVCLLMDKLSEFLTVEKGGVKLYKKALEIIKNVEGPRKDLASTMSRRASMRKSSPASFAIWEAIRTI